MQGSSCWSSSPPLEVVLTLLYVVNTNSVRGYICPCAHARKLCVFVMALLCLAPLRWPAILLHGSTCHWCHQIYPSLHLADFAGKSLYAYTQMSLVEKKTQLVGSSVLYRLSVLSADSRDCAVQPPVCQSTLHSHAYAFAYIAFVAPHVEEPELVVIHTRPSQELQWPCVIINMCPYMSLGVWHACHPHHENTRSQQRCMHACAIQLACPAAAAAAQSSNIHHRCTHALITTHCLSHSPASQPLSSWHVGLHTLLQVLGFRV